MNVSVDCLSPNCSGHGVCVQATCICYKGYWGSDCSLPEVPSAGQGDTLCIPDCSGHGIHIGDPPLCLCEGGYGGPNCNVGELLDT